MTPSGADDAIKIRWLATFPALAAAKLGAQYPAGGIPSTFENETFIQPNPPTPYVALVNDHGIQRRASLGINARHITDGTIYVKMHWPLTAANGFPDGDGWVKLMAEAARDAMSVSQFANGPNEDGVICFNASITPTAQDGGFWILAVTIPFQYAEFR